MQHLLDRHLHVGRGVVGNGVLDVAREVLGQFFHLLAHALGGGQRVGVRRQHNGEGRRRLAVQAGAELVVVGADLDAGHVAQQHLGAIGVGAQHDLAEAVHGAQLTVGRDRGRDALRFRVGRRADAAARDQDVLARDGLVDLVHAQVEAHQLGGIHPDPHGARRREQLELAHAGHARDRVLHVARDVVGQRRLVQRPILGRQRHDHQEAGTGLLVLQALLLHGPGQLRYHVRHAVLHVNLSQVRVGARREGGGDGGRAVGIADRLVIDQALGAVELVFDDTGDRFRHFLGRSARVGSGDRDGRRGHVGVLRHRHVRDGQHPGQQNEQGDYPGENWSINKKLRHVG
ncbi:hypothetical protein D3C86_1381890 [compost metagenome]